MNWVDVLTAWGYPGDIYSVASYLEDLGLDPEYYKNRKLELFNILKQHVQETYGIMATPYEECQKWCTIPIICNFICWLWEQIAQYLPDIGAILVGGLVMALAPGYYRLIGAAPLIWGVYDILVKMGVIKWSKEEEEE